MARGRRSSGLSGVTWRGGWSDPWGSVVRRVQDQTSRMQSGGNDYGCGALATWTARSPGRADERSATAATRRV